MATHKLRVFCIPFFFLCIELLNKRKADYVSFDIDKDDNARKEIIKIVGNDDVESLDKLPIVVAGDKVIYGFDKKEIDKYVC